MTEENEALEADTVVPIVPSEEAEEDFRPFDELSESYSPSAIRKVLGEDGLPTQVSDSGGSDIPVLSADTLICMGDYSEFIQRHWRTGASVGTFSPDMVEEREDGTWCLKSDPSVVVEPKRQRCAHYVRQVTQLPDNPDHVLHVRLCSARRTTEGTFMSVSNVAMWACDMRSPRHLPSEKRHIVSFDKKKAAEGAEREYTSIFGNKEAQK